MTNNIVETRLKLIEIVVSRHGDFNSEPVLDAVRKYEEYIFSDSLKADKVSNAPADTPKAERKGLTVSTKKKPRR